MTEKIISDCCSEKVWVIGNREKLDPNDPESIKKIEPGATYFYQCEKCKRACGWQ